MCFALWELVLAAVISVISGGHVLFLPVLPVATRRPVRASTTSQTLVVASFGPAANPSQGFPCRIGKDH
jgi:hypothetical protein